MISNTKERTSAGVCVFVHIAVFIALFLYLTMGKKGAIMKISMNMAGFLTFLQKNENQTLHPQQPFACGVNPADQQTANTSKESL